MKDNALITKIIRWVVIVAIPFLLMLGSVRVLIGWNSPSYPEWSYGRIAPDAYGFTRAERTDLANATQDYLRRPEPADEVIFMLEDLRIPGSDQPLYNEREIGHMIDVKNVADAFRTVMWVLLAVVVVGLVYLFWRDRLQGADALFKGGLLSAIIVLAIIVFMGVAWSVAFTLFHNLFFASGTWTFSYSDSLIRLFPEQFWFEFGLLWFGSILALGLLLTLAGWLLRRAWRA